MIMAKDYLSTLTFDNYLVTELSYKQNRKFDFDTDELDVPFTIHAKVQLADDKESAVTLTVHCGDEENSACPFLISVEVLGVFKFEEIGESMEELATTSALAILFPYVRSLVSDLSSRSNVYPQFKLPLMNVVEFVNANNTLEVIK